MPLMPPRITPVEQLDYTPGLAYFTCDTCDSVDSTEFERPYCNGYDRYLRVNSSGKPLKCAECLVDVRGDLND